MSRASVIRELELHGLVHRLAKTVLDNITWDETGTGCRYCTVDGPDHLADCIVHEARAALGPDYDGPANTAGGHEHWDVG